MFLHDEVLFTDVNGFDHTHSSIFFALMDAIIWRSYSRPWEAMKACWAFRSCIYGIRAAYGKGRILGRGNTSGNWITTWLNTLYNSFYFAVATIIIAKGLSPEATFADILSQLIAKLYSDDNIVKNKQFNITAEMYAAVFKKHLRITLTSTDKGEVGANSNGTIDDVEFLSRGFRYESGIVYAPLSLDSLMSQLYYVRMPRSQKHNTPYLNAQVQTNIDNVCRDSVELTQEVALSIFTDLSKFIIENGLPYTVNWTFYNDRKAIKMANY